MNTTPFSWMKGGRQSTSWDTLECLWSQAYPNSTVRFGHTVINEPCWTIVEKFDETYLPGVKFAMKRNKLNKQRLTLSDPYNLLGLTLINTNDRSVILTEGVSDFFTIKLLNPDSNVLGVTTLSGSSKTLSILANLFDDFIIVADNDSTGLANATRFSKKLSPYGATHIETPSIPFKDVTDLFMSNLRFT